MISECLVTLFIFVLAAFVAFEAINQILPTLPTPLMAGASAI